MSDLETLRAKADYFRNYLISRGNTDVFHTEWHDHYFFEWKSPEGKYRSRVLDFDKLDAMVMEVNTFVVKEN